MKKLSILIILILASQLVLATQTKDDLTYTVTWSLGAGLTTTTDRKVSTMIGEQGIGRDTDINFKKETGILYVLNLIPEEEAEAEEDTTAENIALFGARCGDLKCEKSENTTNCPEDCLELPLQVTIIGTIKKSPIILFITTMIVSILSVSGIILLLIVIVKKKKEEKEENQIEDEIF